ncbi:transposase [Microtetraspora malaysiensis]|uniref:transposase n=1 Tax=Microtetraspora malaysiensis TaxID=161358 RepID=UPI003D94F819
MGTAARRIAQRFSRIEPRCAANAYVRGLLSDVERKNCWNLAEQAGLTGPQTMRRLPRTARWDADPVRDDVRHYVSEDLGGNGVLIVDEAGFRKKGCRSAGGATSIHRYGRPDRKAVRSACSWPSLTRHCRIGEILHWSMPPSSHRPSMPFPAP